MSFCNKVAKGKNAFVSMCGKISSVTKSRREKKAFVSMCGKISSVTKSRREKTAFLVSESFAVDVISIKNR